MTTVTTVTTVTKVTTATMVTPTNTVTTVTTATTVRQRQVLAYHNSSLVPFPVKRIPIQARTPGGRKNLHLSGDFASGTQVRFTGTPLRNQYLVTVVP